MHVYHNATPQSPCACLCLRCGTSLERITAESLTRKLFDFVHREIWEDWRTAIPDRVLAAIFAAAIAAEMVNTVRNHDSARSQGRVRCG